MNSTRIKILFSLAAVLAATYFFKAKQLGFHTANDLIGMHEEASLAGKKSNRKQSAHSAQITSAKLDVNAPSHDAASANAGTAAIGRSPASEQEQVIKFLKEKTNANWNAETHDDHVVSVSGSKVKAALVGSDEKLAAFVSEMAGAMGFDKNSVSPNPELKKVTEHEIINEFKQSIDNVEIYGAYGRAFRDADNKDATFFITEFKKYDEVVNDSSVNEPDVLAKLDEYYRRLSYTVQSKSCGSKVYYIDDNKVAHLAYKCIVKATAQQPEVYEVVVSAANSDVLYQKRMTIYN